MYVDYVADPTFKRRENNQLIDPDTAEPNPELTDKSERAMAEIAAVFHRNAPSLTPAQLEQVATWAKRWKLGVAGRLVESRPDYWSVLEALRNSVEQKSLQDKAVVKLLKSGFFCAVSLALAVVSIYAVWVLDFGWGWRAALAAPLLTSMWWADSAMREGQSIAKEQDRRYALASLRSAKTVSELNQAGLFTYMPHTAYGEPGFDERRAMKLIRAEVERLTDALYSDRDGWLMSTEYPWLNKDEEEPIWPTRES